MTALDTTPATHPTHQWPLPPVTPPNAQILAEAHARSDAQAKPLGALGRLESLAAWVSACQGVCPPLPLDDVRVVVLTGDHGVSDHGVSAYPAAVTTAIVNGAATGYAGINALAHPHGIAVRVLDIACQEDTLADHRYKICRSSNPLHLRDALTREQTLAALNAGAAIADEEIDDGAQLLITGDIGIGNTTPAAALIAATCSATAQAAAGPGTGLDDAGVAAKAALIQTALDRVGDRAADPVERLAALGGADLAAAAGLMARAAQRGVPVLLDGVISVAEAVLAAELAPGSASWFLAGHLSPEPACQLGLTHLGLDPIIDLGMRLGEGTGAVCAVPIVRTAIAALRDLALLSDLTPVSHPTGPDGDPAPQS
ncbi:Nicotinate-nucleotide--dimethylbenzimidazole phosphoribosyltransferase [Austwickia sp. TVS 96-490-7B]|uniref:nicotinate-nucleotide--dimethylbenzimidazole phosphoribosyltransferase n=1 Tax=Austwickia sp. TVS 96-490-7B TaxID=2830843 RepID=UPI001C5874DE|nr:nicotinate-nucleotide--dimethylbenzimidazole phosphoribosyltransferase [Austwickia sp. TVS 96-490-7B]MBW3084760.1 Nicotinate-nucleotide--dimethylbenzimidazole phosphoribosyltransferase [Austwickia sp. TVS 96-490-7B]